METFIVNMAQTLHNVHDRANCRGPACTIHRPTEHHLRDWPLYWREDAKKFERICPHGDGHPDPDCQTDPTGIHGCHSYDLYDGDITIMCCSKYAQYLRNQSQYPELEM